MQYRNTVDLSVPADQAWAVLAELGRWPDWTPTVEWVRTDPGSVRVGQVVHIKQPGRKVVRYTVDVADPGSRFRWGSHRNGVRQAADHVVDATGPNSCRVALTFTMGGPIGAVLGALGATKIRGMVDAEAAALTRRFGATDDASAHPD